METGEVRRRRMMGSIAQMQANAGQRLREDLAAVGPFAKKNVFNGTIICFNPKIQPNSYKQMWSQHVPRYISAVAWGRQYSKT